jgi:hypothetical protein
MVCISHRDVAGIWLIESSASLSRSLLFCTIIRVSLQHNPVPRIQNHNPEQKSQDERSEPDSGPTQSALHERDQRTDPGGCNC